MEEESVSIYSPKSEFSHPFKLFGQSVRSIGQKRELIWILMTRDIKGKYRQAFLGYAWLIFPPVLTTGLWVYLTSQNLVNISDTGIPYPLYVLIGQIIWSAFSTSINAPITGIDSGSSVFTRLKVPPEVFIFAGVGGAAFDILLRSILLTIVASFMGAGVQITLPLFFAVLVIVMLFGSAIGVLLAPLAFLIKDIPRIVVIGLPFLMYTTPAIFPIPEAGVARMIMEWNPLTPLICAGRDWATVGSSTYSFSVIIIGVVSVLTLLVGLMILRVALPRMVERMGM